MTENKSYELTINERGQLNIIDHIEGKKRNAICIYNDLGVPPFSSAKAICNKLNEQEEEIRKLTEEVVRLRLEPQLKQNKKSIKDAVEVNNLLKKQEENNQLKKENEQLKQAYQTLKHRHSLLHDVCIEAECDRYMYYNDVVSLEKENEQLKKENENQNNILEDFMVMLNRLQAEPDNKSLQIMAKDMLRMMGKEIMGDD